ncbi:MAG: efflux RND transporter periplasmic adaptor subunit, partial [Acidobacteriota bacterium]|nr:efflux RND transporter periplasmic adaptor subunit [Acidobacteriota bacterium]
GSSLLATIYSINPVYVNFSVSEANYLEFQKRAGRGLLNSFPPVEIILGDNSLYPYKGRIDMVSPQVDPSTGTLGMRAEAPNPGGVLRSGLFVRVRMRVQDKPNALLVPVQAVQEVQGVQSVLVVDAENKVEFHTVAAGDTVNNMRIVESGLQPGARVIVQGLQKVRPGMTVKPQEEAVSGQPPATGGEPRGARTFTKQN